MNSYHSTYLACLDDTAKAIVSDNREQAQACVASLDPETSQRVEALLIRAWTCDSIQETEIAMQQALEINPDNETAIAGLNWIHGIQDLAECQLEAKRQAEEAARLQAEEAARLQAEEAARLQAEEAAAAANTKTNQSSRRSKKLVDKQRLTSRPSLNQGKWSKHTLLSKLRNTLGCKHRLSSIAKHWKWHV